MDDSGNWSSSAIVNVRGRAGDGSSGGKPAKKGTNNVCEALCDKLGVAVMAVTGEPIGHYRGKQGLDGSKQRDRHRRFNERSDSFQADIRELKWRQSEWDCTGPKLRTDCLKA